MTPPPGAAAAADAITRRMEELGLTQQDLARIADVSTSTIRKLQRGTQPVYQRAKLAALSRALQWPPDGIWRLLEGADVESLTGRAADHAPAALSGKFARLSDRDRRYIEELMDRLLDR